MLNDYMKFLPYAINGVISVAFVMVMVGHLKPMMDKLGLSSGYHYRMLSFSLCAVPVIGLDFSVTIKALTGSELNGLESLLLGCPVTFAIVHVAYELINRIDFVDSISKWWYRKLGLKSDE